MRTDTFFLAFKNKSSNRTKGHFVKRRSDTCSKIFSLFAPSYPRALSLCVLVMDSYNIDVYSTDAFAASRVSWFVEQTGYAVQIPGSFSNYVGPKWRPYQPDVPWYGGSRRQSHGTVCTFCNLFWFYQKIQMK